jgi:para-aminobenzoate synthetase
MTFNPMTFHWTGQDFEPIAATVEPDILVADSWRARQGTTWGIQDHIARFVNGIAAQHTVHGAVPRVELAAFVPALERQLTAIAQQQPGTDLFPRISVEKSGEYFRTVLLVRPAPQPRETTTLLVPDYTDPRTRPTIKGPDISLLRRLVAQASTDDVVLHDGTNVIETTTGALMLWRAPNEVVLCQSSHQLASISARRVAEQARTCNISVVYRSVSMKELASGQYPVWCTNTLHGISAVTSIGDGQQTTSIASHPDTARWQNAWWRHFDSPSTTA